MKAAVPVLDLSSAASDGSTGSGRSAVLRLIWPLLLALWVLIPAAQAQSVKVDSVRAELTADHAVVQPGQSFQVGLHLVHDQGWHTYWRNPGDSGLPTQFPLALPPDFAVGEIQWPIPTRLLIPPLANLGFESDVLLTREVTIPADFQGDSLELSTLAQWLVCREVCIPGETNLKLKIPVAVEAVKGSSDVLFQLARAQLPSGSEVFSARIADGLLKWQLPDAVMGAPDEITTLEYFPYTGGFARHAAPQLLGRQADQSAWQLEVALEPLLPPLPPLPGQTPLPAPPPLGLEQATGLIVINKTRAVEVKAALAPAAVFAGQLEQVTSIEGHIVPIFEQMNAAAGLLAATGGARGSSGGLADRLSGALGGGSDTGLSSTGTFGGLTTLAPAAAAPAAAGSAALQSVWVALIFAAIGGLILNLMPCVFPIIGLKILGFAGSGAGGGELSDAARQKVRYGSLWFAAGVIVSFLALSGLLLGLRAAGESVGWGFQLQSPVFVVLMALLFVAIGLNFSGVFEVGTSLTRLGNLQSATAPEESQSTASAFGSGVLAVLVATPCTAPFMGSAMGFTLAQSASVTLLIFAALGFGMALPYLALGFAPGWLRWLPRPGRWMETLRQFMAFPMFAAAVWLAWVLGLQAGLDAVLALALGAVALALGLWVWGRLFQQSRSASRGVYALIAIALSVGALVMAWPQTTKSDVQADAQLQWQDWSSDELGRVLASGRPVFIDFTAAWCITCQVNKRLVLQSEAVIKAFNRANVVVMQADWTTRDARITAELARHGRNGVPLYLLYRPDGRSPQVLPELLTSSLVINALNQ